MPWHVVHIVEKYHLLDRILHGDVESFLLFLE